MWAKEQTERVKVKFKSEISVPTGSKLEPLKV